MLKHAAVGFLMAACLMGGVVRAADDILSGDEVKKLVDAGQYRDALKSLVRILSLKGPLADPYDRYDMLMLQAECQIQIRESVVAIASFKAAVDEAILEKKPERIAAPRAMIELLQHSMAFQYKPKTGPAAVISLLDRTKRKDALTALLADELPPVTRKTREIPRIGSVTAILDAAKVIGVMRAVEIAATNDTVQTDEIVTAISKQGQKLMGSALDEFDLHANAIAKRASELITENVPQVDQISGKAWFIQKTHKRGPTNDERQSLQDILATCNKISVAEKAVAEALGTEFEAMDAIRSESENIKAEVNDILTADYSVEVKKPQ